MRTKTISSRRVLLDGELRPALLEIAHGRVSAVREYSERTRIVHDEHHLGLPDGLVVLPGAIDTQVDLDEPGPVRREGFFSGTEAAAAGGATTIVPLPFAASPPTTDLKRLLAKRAAAVDSLRADIAFPVGVTPENLSNLDALWDAGVPGLVAAIGGPAGSTPDSGSGRTPIALSEYDFATAMRRAARCDALVLVHLGGPGSAQEIVALDQAIAAVRTYGTRTHLMSVASAAAVDKIAAARADGLPITAATSPHFLTFAAESIDADAPEFRCRPAIGARSDREALWSALTHGVLDVIASGHCPASIAEMTAFDSARIDPVGLATGVSGLQVALPLVLQGALERGHFITDVSRWTAENPARIFGLPGKGRIGVGNDADLTIIDPDARGIVDVRALSHLVTASAYDGMSIRSRVVTTILRGHVVFDGRHSHGLTGREVRRGYGVVQEPGETRPLRAAVE